MEEATDFVPPTVNQIRLAYPQLTPGHLVTSQQLQQLLLDLGLHQGTLDKVGFGILQGSTLGLRQRPAPGGVFLPLVDATLDKVGFRALQGFTLDLGQRTTLYTMWCMGWRLRGQVASRQLQQLCLDMGST